MSIKSFEQINNLVDTSNYTKYSPLLKIDGTKLIAMEHELTVLTKLL